MNCCFEYSYMYGDSILEMGIISEWSIPYDILHATYIK